ALTRSCAAPSRRVPAPGRSGRSWCSPAPSRSAGSLGRAPQAHPAAESAVWGTRLSRTRQESAAAPRVRRTRERRPGSSAAPRTAASPDNSALARPPGRRIAHNLIRQRMADEQPRTGARQRRRGLYGPPPLLTRTSPLTGRLVWHIGDWGRASEHIGNRWEHVAGTLARERLGADDHLVVLAATPTLMAEVLGSGLPHADALRTWRDDGHLALEPLDFK